MAGVTLCEFGSFFHVSFVLAHTRRISHPPPTQKMLLGQGTSEIVCLPKTSHIRNRVLATNTTSYMLDEVSVSLSGSNDFNSIPQDLYDFLEEFNGFS